ncbi:MAG TPA: aminotransferase class V-fold PLP-dependent enzyme [Candidatus Acidoferrales bacterium]|nr:aminotransferase class V-fold PLP-dependent enzyme [Candidatus Acidoferrales bacterium]
MDLSRRRLLGGLCSLPMLASRVSWSLAPDERGHTSLPDKASFPFDGVYLDAAYTHPMSLATRSSYVEYLKHRVVDDSRIGPGNNGRDSAVHLYAKLINADPTEIAVVPSTMEGENLIAASLGLNQAAGVVTDALHYDASLVLYGELAKRGIPLKVVAPRGGGIDLADVEAAIGKDTRLVAVSLVSATTGFQYDLKALADLAHSKGAFLYADIIQAAGAIPVDVKATGVDFCSCGCYKWLMGDFGTAFLYVRPDRLNDLKRVQVGWRQVRRQTTHVFPFDAPGSALGEWTLGSETAAMFEVSTPAWGSLACVAESLAYIESVGIEAIVRHRKPLIDHLRQELPKRGFEPLTPAESAGPMQVFSYRGAAARFGKTLRDANIQISTYANRIRISPSVYNDMEDIEKLLRVLSA